MLFAGSPGTTWRSRPSGRRPWASWPRGGGWTRPRPRSSWPSTSREPARGAIRARIADVRAEIERYGTYRHTAAELAFGAQVAWRNSSRCIGRLYWRSLRVRDRRDVARRRGHGRRGGRAPARGHQRRAGSGRSSPSSPRPRPAGRGPRIWNEQLIRYAGYRPAGRAGRRRPAQRRAHRGRAAASAGPAARAPRSTCCRWSIAGARATARGCSTCPTTRCWRCRWRHPDAPTGSPSLGLRWHAVPAISNMCLEIGGICYPAAPVQRLVHGHRDRRPQPRRRRPLRPAAGRRRPPGPGHLQRAHRSGRTGRWSS